MKWSKHHDITLGRTSPGLLAILVSVAIVTRIVGAVFLPNAEQDGYSYAEIIARVTQCFEHGRLHVSDLYGFWLPLFQIVTAVLNLGIHDPIIAGKIVNVLCGAGSAVLVFDLTRLLTNSLTLSLVAFVVIVADPLHILYSAACMTDIPHGCLVLLSLWFACRLKWTAAAIAGALAGCIRVESWALLFVLPVLQLIGERRLSLVTIAILLIPPLGWLGITYFATGHPLTYFHDRANYHVEYIAFHPERRGFDPTVIGTDLNDFLLGAGKMVTVGTFAVAIGTVFKWLRTRTIPNVRLLIVTTYYFGLLGLIVVAYVTKAQPVILPRYGLTFFVAGLPLFAAAFQFVMTWVRQTWLKAAFALFIAALLVVEGTKKFSILPKVCGDFRAHKTIALKLAHEAQDLPGARYFSDDVAVRVLSGLPVDRFVRTARARRDRVTTAESFVVYLRDQSIEFMVYFPTEDSLPVKFFPQLGRKPPVSDNEFESLAFAESNFGPDIWLYRIR